MKIIVPDYYKDFKCIAGRCKHTCCKGWEVEIDDESLERYEEHPEISKHIEKAEDNHFALLDGEVCPFLREDGLCRMILEYGEDMLCQTCTDHPRFRNYWGNCIEMGLGLVCEEAARLILTKDTPMQLEVLSDDKNNEELSSDEEWLLNVRNELLAEIDSDGPVARLREYLIFRHIADALYDDRLEERIALVDYIENLIKCRWEQTDGSIDSLIEIARTVSYDIEYDEEEKERIIKIASLG